jgi:hypothetical protein
MKSRPHENESMNLWYSDAGIRAYMLVVEASPALRRREMFSKDFALWRELSSPFDTLPRDRRGRFCSWEVWRMTHPLDLPAPDLSEGAS